ncbi:MAG: oligosaccharide flippase family protein [Eubacteriales bacterium]
MKNKYLKSFLALLTGNGFSQLINLIFIILLVRIMSVEYYAVYRQGNLLIMTFAPILTLGLSMSISYFVPKCETRDEKKTYVFQTAAILLIMGIIWFVLVMSLSGFISETYNNPLLKKYLWVFGITGLSTNLFSFYPFFMCAEGMNRRLAKIVIFFALIKCATIPVYYISGYNINVFFGAFVATELLKSIFISFDTMRYYKGTKPKFTKKTFFTQIKFGIPIALTNMVTAYNKNIDKNFVSVSNTPDLYATYSNGAFEVPLISAIRQSMTGAFLPLFSKEYDVNKQESLDNIANVFKKAATYSAVVILPLMFSLILYSKGAMLFMFSEKYISATPIFIIYLLLLPTQITDFGTPLVVAGKQKYTVMFRVVGAVLNTILCTVLSIIFKDYRLIALAPVLTEYFVVIATLIKTSRIFKQKKLFAFLPGAGLMKIALVCIGVCAVFYFAGGYISIAEPYRSMILGPLCFTACVVPCMMMFDYTRNMLVNIIKKLLRRN